MAEQRHQAVVANPRRNCRCCPPATSARPRV